MQHFTKGRRKSRQYFGQHCSPTFVGQHDVSICYGYQHVRKKKSSQNVGQHLLTF